MTDYFVTRIDGLDLAVCRSWNLPDGFREIRVELTTWNTDGEPTVQVVPSDGIPRELVNDKRWAEVVDQLGDEESAAEGYYCSNLLSRQLYGCLKRLLARREKLNSLAEFC